MLCKFLLSVQTIKTLYTLGTMSYYIKAFVYDHYPAQSAMHWPASKFGLVYDHWTGLLLWTGLLDLHFIF